MRGSPSEGFGSVLTTRLATATVLVVLVLGCLFFAPIYITGLLLAVFLLGAGWEWPSLIGRQGTGARFLFVAVLATLAYFVWRWNGHEGLFSLLQQAAAAWWLVALVLVGLAQLQRIDGIISLVSNEAIGLVVLLPAWSAIVWLLGSDRVMLLALFILIWVADAAAFFVGRRWGRRRLASHVSPGKSWAGVGGGLFFGALSAAFFSHFIVLSDRAKIAFVVVAIVTVAVSVVGDLFESMLKRHAGLKDSSNILPGHGGVMDRIDGLVAAAPIFALGLSQWVYRI